MPTFISPIFTHPSGVRIFAVIGCAFPPPAAPPPRIIWGIFLFPHDEHSGTYLLFPFSSSPIYTFFISPPHKWHSGCNAFQSSYCFNDGEKSIRKFCGATNVLYPMIIVRFLLRIVKKEKEGMALLFNKIQISG